MSRIFQPLTDHATWRRWSFMVVGGGLLMPYWFLGMLVLPLLPYGDSVAVTVTAMLVLPTVGTFITGLVPIVRVLEGSMARELLGGPAAALGPGPSRSWESRSRTGAWFSLHLLTGVLVSGPSLAVPPLAFVLLAAPLVRWDESFLDAWGWQVSWQQWFGPAGGLLALAALLAWIVAAGRVMARLAPRFLGPSADERLAESEARAVRLAERNRLARELHDSVGHALSVVTLQAGAAGRVLDTDPAFAREALGAIEDSARSALEDLDHVLGLLREDSTPRTAPQLTLADLGRLLEQTRIAGVRLDAEVDPEVAHVPAAVSREAYRIVQEGLTNALRHAGKVPVRLRVGIRDDRLEIDMSNPLGAPAEGAGHGGGRGLGGIRERVTVLRGRMTAGPAEGRWRMDVSLPLGHG
ncbi:MULTISPECIES: sensor histidine kinase [Thermomonosporaceae]|uniref:sensor histidine kinase n=1 Tax=Thermomonosporaceae TaxID=2012 RepID=UPI00255B32FB|nr:MULTISPECIES: histidine kinase [Thermomonosporaceae]MDL4771285.1 histidine kinase [Actinomadura xylanilytica]